MWAAFSEPGSIWKTLKGSIMYKTLLLDLAKWQSLQNPQSMETEIFYTVTVTRWRSFLLPPAQNGSEMYP